MREAGNELALFIEQLDVVGQVRRDLPVERVEVIQSNGGDENAAQLFCLVQ